MITTSPCYLGGIADPVTSAKPKFINADIKVLMPTSTSTTISLTCPAQGFPVPIARSVIVPIVIVVVFFFSNNHGGSHSVPHC